MIHRENILEYNAETVDLSKRGVSEWSLPAEATVPGDPWAPSAPTISAAAADQAIDLTLTRPTTNVDGTTCTDFKEFKVYYSTSSGIDTSNPSTYDGTFYTQATNHTYPTTATTYFVATAIDKNGNESSASSEVNATPTSSGYTPAIDDYTNNIANVYTGDGIIGIEFQPPKSTWVRWAGWKLYYDVDTGSGWSGSWTEIYIGSGPGFVHKGLTTTYAYKYKLTALGEDGSETTGTISDNSGAGYTPNATDNSALVAVTILAKNIITENEVRAAHIKAGTITGDKISSATTITAGSGDNVGVLDGADATWRIYAGSATPSSAPFRVDQTGALYASNATISGTVTIGAGSSGISNLSDAGDLATLDVVGTAQIENLAVTNAKIDDLAVTGAKIANATITSAKISDLSFSKITAGTSNASITIGSSGYIKSSNYSAGSAGFKIDGDGDAEFNDVTVRGALITQAGSALNADYLTAGTITGRTVKTASSGAMAAMYSSGGYSHSFAITNASSAMLALLSGSTLTLHDAGSEKIRLDGASSPPEIYFSATSKIYSQLDLTVAASTGSGHTLTLDGYYLLLGAGSEQSGCKVTFGGDIGFSSATMTTGKSGLDKYLRILIAGTTYYLRLYQ